MEFSSNNDFDWIVDFQAHLEEFLVAERFASSRRVFIKQDYGLNMQVGK